MKKFLQYILAILLFSFLGVILTNKTSIEPVFRQALYKLNINRPCSQPIKYAIGNIDPGFNLSESDLEKTILEAEKIWEEPVGKNLFQYDPSSLFRINMVYDERQKRTQDSQKLQDNLDLLESTHQAVISQYNNVSSAYKKRLDNYNKAVDKYEASLTKYNDEVDSWNAKGGAPTDVFNELKKEKKKG